MAKKKKCEEHANHEAWAIPYGDLVTLLLAFFVVMYALSSVNEGKYRILSESLAVAFRGGPTSPDPIQIGEPVRSLIVPPDGVRGIELVPEREIIELPENWDELERGFDVDFAIGLMDDFWESRGGGMTDRNPARDAASAGEDQDEEEIDDFWSSGRGMDRIGDEIERALGFLIAQELIRVTRDQLWVEVEINTSVLFDSGSADVFTEARSVLSDIAQILVQFPVRVHVEGFTDNVPINTPVFPSNWELSAGRASSVIRLFSNYGLDPTRMAAIGFGEYRPVYDNETAEGRRKNRRVVIVVLPSRHARQSAPVDPERLGEQLGAISRPSSVGDLRVQPSGNAFSDEEGRL